MSGAVGSLRGRTERSSNASALPTCPQQQQPQQITDFKKGLKRPTRLHNDASLIYVCHAGNCRMSIETWQKREANMAKQNDKHNNAAPDAVDDTLHFTTADPAVTSFTIQA